MALTPEQVRAMAQEIVQHVKGEAKRTQEEREARSGPANKADTDAKREARLVDEVTRKLTQALGEAVEADGGNGGEGSGSSGSGSAPSAAGTQSSTHRRT